MFELGRTQPGDYFALFNGFLQTGLVSFGLNELNLRSLIDDPPKYTLESRSGALGGWSARYVLPNGSPVELALIQFKKDERTRGRDDVLWGEWTIHLRAQPEHADDDGMRLVFLATHDYVWVKGLSPSPSPLVPIVELPPPSEPLPVDDWLTAESQSKRAIEIVRLREEMHPTPLDEGRVAAYMSGRNRNLAEVHDDELLRSGKQPDPCGGANRHPVA
jgi:hypothetical protein